MKHLFYRKGKEEKWHWHKNCSHFPHGKVREISFFFKKEGNEFCEECNSIDTKNENELFQEKLAS